MVALDPGWGWVGIDCSKFLLGNLQKNSQLFFLRYCFKMVGFLDFGTFFSCFSLVANFFQMGNLAVESEARVL